MRGGRGQHATPINREQSAPARDRLLPRRETDKGDELAPALLVGADPSRGNIRGNIQIVSMKKGVLSMALMLWR
jgi:hypothetical protein